MMTWTSRRGCQYNLAKNVISIVTEICSICMEKLADGDDACRIREKVMMELMRQVFKEVTLSRWLAEKCSQTHTMPINMINQVGKVGCHLTVGPFNIETGCHFCVGLVYITVYRKFKLVYNGHDQTRACQRKAKPY